MHSRTSATKPGGKKLYFLILETGGENLIYPTLTRLRVNRYRLTRFIHLENKRGAGPPLVLLALTPKVAAPLFPGFGKGGRYNAQPLELLIYVCNFNFAAMKTSRCKPHRSPSFENRKGWGSHFCI